MTNEYDESPNVTPWGAPPPPAVDDAPNVSSWLPELPQYVPEPTYEVPDVAPNVSSWRSIAAGTAPDPYSTAALSTPAMPPPQSYYEASASPWETAGRAFGALTESAAPGAHPVVEELLRPANYIGAGGGAMGLARGALSGIGARYASDYAMEALPEDANPYLRGAVGLGAGLIGGGAGFVAPDVAQGLARAGANVAPDVAAGARRLAMDETGSVRLGSDEADDAIASLVTRKMREGLTPQQIMRDPEFQALQAKSGFMPDYNAVPEGPTTAADTTAWLRNARVQEARAATQTFGILEDRTAPYVGIPEGHVRVFRGESGGAPSPLASQRGNYSPAADFAERFAGSKGKILYTDVPRSRAGDWQMWTADMQAERTPGLNFDEIRVAQQSGQHPPVLEYMQPPTPSTLEQQVANMERAGYKRVPSTRAEWIAPDGSTLAGPTVPGFHAPHADANNARQGLPRVTGISAGGAEEVAPMLEEGWIRRAGPLSYQLRSIDENAERLTGLIRADLRSMGRDVYGTTGKTIWIDTGWYGHRQGQFDTPQSLTIEEFRKSGLASLKRTPQAEPKPQTILERARAKALEPRVDDGMSQQQAIRGMLSDEMGGIRLGDDPSQRVPYEAAATASGRLFGIRAPSQGLSRADSVLNQLKETIGVGVPENATATPIMRERKRVMAAVESQATRMGAVADDVMRTFPTDKAGRIQNVPGNPTVQDLAAHLPEYDPFLTSAQRAAIERLRVETEPFRLAMAENGVDVRSRADVVDGGFYLPRGRADIEGMDVPLKVGTGRGGAGGKRGFERGAVFDSMAQGIANGYRYAPFRDALQSYAKDAGTRAIDSWAANEFKATGLGETPSARLLRQNPQLVAKKAALNDVLSRFRSMADNLTAQQQAQIERFLHDPNAFEPDEIRDLLDVVNSRGLVTPAQARQAYADTRAVLNELAPEWRRAMERARQTPRDQGSIGFAQLNGSTFPDEIANVANKYLNAEKPLTGRGAIVLNTADAFNNLVRMLRSTADVSFMGLQGLLGAASHPVAYKKALVVALKSLRDEKALGAFVRDFDARALSEGRPDSRAWASTGARFGGTATEFTGGIGIAGRIPNAIANAPVIKQTNRAFGTFGDALRLATDDALYKARTSGGKTLTPEQMGEIAKFGNLMTGWSERRFGGEFGPFLQFAPRFFQSQLDLLGNALTSRGIVGDEARRSLGALVGIGTALTVAANEARGKDTDFRLIVNGEVNPNFVRILDVKGMDISLFGQWDSLVRALMSAGQGDFGYLARSKASPIVSMAWDQISGKSFMGEDTRNIEYILRSFLPFGLSDLGQKGPLTSAIGATGVKASPRSRTEQVESGRYGELEGPDQLKAVRAQSWRAVRTDPKAPPELASYASMYDYKQAKQAEAYAEELGKVTKDYPEGQPEGVALQRAESRVTSDPVNKAYRKAQTQFENEWIKANPQLAKELDIKGQKAPWTEGAWQMTIEQRKLAEDTLAGKTPTPTPAPRSEVPGGIPAMAGGGVVEDGKVAPLSDEQWKTVLKVIKDVVRDDGGKMVSIAERHDVPDKPAPKKRVVKETERSKDGKIARVTELHQEAYA